MYVQKFLMKKQPFPALRFLTGGIYLPEAGLAALVALFPGSYLHGKESHASTAIFPLLLIYRHGALTSVSEYLLSQVHTHHPASLYYTFWTNK